MCLRCDRPQEQDRLEPNLNRTVGAPLRLLWYLGFEIAPASENTQRPRGSKILLAGAPGNGSSTSTH